MLGVVASAPSGTWLVQDREMPKPGPRDLLVRVRASGLCMMDVRQARGEMGYHGITPGHEFVGDVIDAGHEVTGVQTGQLVGATWHQRWCRTCEHCLRGRLELCRSADETGIHINGGHAEYAVIDAASAVIIPDGLAPEAAAALLCSGYAAYSALVDLGVSAFCSLAVLGLGGIGHLAVQYGRAMGARRVVVVTSRPDKEQLARELGADDVIACQPGDDFAPALKALGQVDRIVLTTEATGALASGVESLAPYGQLAVLPATVQPVPLPLQRLLHFKLTVRGSSQGPRNRLGEMFGLHQRCGARILTETFPLGQAGEVLDRVGRRAVRLRAVLVP
jgi:dehydrogenase